MTLHGHAARAPKAEPGRACYRRSAPQLPYFLLASSRGAADLAARRRAGADHRSAGGRTGRAASRIPRRVAIRFLTDSDYPPFNYYDEDNVLTGFNVDIARAVCLELAAACDIQVRPWPELLTALRRGEADAVIASHAVSAGALKAVDFTDRYYHTPARFAGKRNTGRLDATPEGLEGKKIAVTKGTAHEAYLRTFFRDSSVRTFDTPELARDALISGAADLLFDDGITLAFWLNGTASKACCEFKGGPFGEPKYFGDGVAIAVNRVRTRSSRGSSTPRSSACARAAATRSWCCATSPSGRSDRRPPAGPHRRSPPKTAGSRKSGKCHQTALAKNSRYPQEVQQYPVIGRCRLP